MFKKLASDALGLSDIGSVIKPIDYDKVEADDFILHEDQEKIYFLIKSKTDEYCFTNLAFIHLDGTSAISKKRLLKRYEFDINRISNVSLETAGTVDFDAEIKFNLGNESFSIDVHKKHGEELKDLYKALLKIGEIQRENGIALEYAKQSLQLASSTLNRSNSNQVPLFEEFKELNQLSFVWLMEKKQEFSVKDFGSVFERYIHN